MVALILIQMGEIIQDHVNPRSHLMKRIMFAAVFLLSHLAAVSAEITVSVALAEKQGSGPALGTIRVVETAHGLAFYPSIKALPPGLHGFHVHENPTCAPAEKDGSMVAALAAGGHLDPAGSRKHGEPWGDGHLGDLPPLYVAADGSATSPVLGPRLKLSDVRRRSLMIHAGADNHADHPMPLGGGAARLACGVIDG